MEANFHPRLKRKDFQHVDDDFSDFSFTSPATKIRRLDAELPPMMRVDEEPEVAAVAQRRRCNESSGVKIEELPDLGENEERAIVLFKPSITTPIVHSPSNFSVSLHPQFISGFKNQILRPDQANSWRLVNEEEEDEDEDDSSRSGNGCQAVVPWFPPRFPPSGDGQFEMMDAEEMGEASMDVEDSEQQRNTNEVSLSQGLPHQWQHCMIPQPPHNTTAPTNCMVPVPVILHQSR
ncbi:hypothetical protein C2S51_000917 [Perilla frutescens var. frutescens]|nr:hypothetical protein C2S51_000917 [Perilla frutescens var. frutescens]